MTISNITADPIKIRAIDTGLFQDKTDQELIDLKLVSSRNEIKLDLYLVLDLVNKDNKETLLNSLIEKHTEDFQRLLMYCQLKNYFFELMTIQSLDQERYITFNRLYKELLERMKRYKSSTFAPLITGSLIRG